MKLISFTLSFIMAIIASGAVSAANDEGSYTVPMSQSPSGSDNEKPEYIDDSPLGHRMPQRPVICTISRRDGVLLQSTGAGEIISYEIRTADGQTCLFVSDSEADFIEVLFQMQGDLLIIFQTETTTFSGYLTV